MSSPSVPVIPAVNVGSSTNPTLLWNYTAGNDSFYSSPDVVNGIVYIDSSYDGTIYALNATNGAKIWNYTTGGSVYSSPAVVNGVAYVGSSDGNVYALNADSGEKLWNFTTAYARFLVNEVDSSPVVAGGVVYIGSDDGNIYALNSSTGAKLWNYTTDGFVWSSAVADGIIYVDSYDNTLYALNATNGDRLWNLMTGTELIYWSPLWSPGEPAPVESPILSSPVVEGDVVYVGSDNGTAYALNAESGTVLWNYTTYIGDVSSPILSTPDIINGVLYVSNLDNGIACSYGNIYALNATNGEKIWNSTTSGEFDTSPVVDDGVIYAGSYGGGEYAPINVSFCALNATDGDQIWDFATGCYQTTSPALSDGVVYAGGDNTVYALRVASPTAQQPDSTTFSNSQLIIIGLLVAVIVAATVVLLILRRKLKTNQARPTPAPPNSFLVSSVKYSIDKPCLQRSRGKDGFA